MTTKQYKFQVEIDQLMNIMINNLYTNKDIFIRELISNSSDAINKLSNIEFNNLEKFETFIKIFIDKNKKIVSIYDNGIGMNEADLINNIGTIAQSGTKLLKDNNKLLIGQFGVGFYSSFLVSDKITIITKKIDCDKIYKWESIPNNNFVITEYNNVNDVEDLKYIEDIYNIDFKYGTIINCYLKKECYDYTDNDKLKTIILKHNQFINNDILLYDGFKKSFEIINKCKSIWNKTINDLKKEDYYQFYKDFYNINEEPIYYKIISGEGNINYKGLLYIPQNNVVDMFDKNKKNNIKLYVKKILITENSKELCPEWLSFIIGIIDTEDISLNVSRDMLQYDNNIKTLRRMFIKKSIDVFNELKQSNDKGYIHFFEKYGKFLKLGVHDEEETFKTKLKKLLIFKSLNTDDKYITLDEYINTLTDVEKEKKIIYYIIGDTYKGLINSPYIEKFKFKGYNILMMIEPSDEYMMETFQEYEGYEFICISKGILYLNDTDDEKSLYDSKAEDFKDLCDYIKQKIGNSILLCKISLYLTSPCIVYAAQYGASANMQRIINAQSLLTKTKQMENQMYYKNIEINPNNKAIIKLKDYYDNKDFDNVDKLINLIYNTALLHSGYTITDNHDYIKNIYKFIVDSTSVVTVLES
jgi:molecular chaperone HtpG